MMTSARSRIRNCMLRQNLCGGGAWRPLANVILLALALVAPSLVFAQDGATDSIVVRLRVNRDYKPGTANTAAAIALARALPRAVDTVPHATTFHKLIFDYYNLSIGDSAKKRGQVNERLFDSLSTIIAADNPLTQLAANIIPRGEIVLPMLPAKAAWLRPAGAAAAATVSTIRLDPDALFTKRSATGTRELRMSAAVLATLARVDSSTIVDVFVQLPADDARALVGSVGAAGIVTATAVDAPVVVQAPLESADAPDTTISVRAAALRETLSAVGRHPNARPATLVVLDFGFPNAPEYERSCQSLKFLVDTVADWWGVTRDAHLTCPAATNLPHIVKHTPVVADALKPFSSTMPGLVDVIYIPFFRDTLSGPMLRAIVRTGRAIEVKKALLSGTDGTAIMDACAADPAERDFARECTLGHRIPLAYMNQIDSLAADFVHKLKDSVPANESKYRIQGLAPTIAYLISVLGEAAHLLGSGIFLNTSWTAYLSDNLDLAPPSADDGVFVVAAAGNDSMQVIGGAQSRDMVRWARGSSTVLAVLNATEPDSLRCRSNWVNWRAPYFGQTNVVAFDGVVPGAGCGTSFSSPRVAWVLAAREALRVGPLPEMWASTVVERIRSSRGAATLGLGSVLFDPAVLLRKVP